MRDINNIDFKVKEALKEKIEAHIYNMWIDPLNILDAGSDTIDIICKNNFFKKQVVTRFSDQIKNSIFSLSGMDGKRVEFKIVQGDNEKFDTSSAKEAKNRIIKVPNRKPVFSAQNSSGHTTKRQLSLNFDLDMAGRALRKEFTMDNFIVGNNSEFAYSATLAMMSGHKMAYNSVFVQSLPGLGKSHLAQAAGNHVLSHDPLKSVFYVSAEDFTNEMVRSIQNDRLNEFKAKYRRQCDVLLMDDVHYLTGKQRTQKELCMILDYLMEADKKIIFSSCSSPLEIPKMDSQLRSRLSSSLMSTIDKPDFETRRRIAQKKAIMHGYNLSDDIIEYLAGELTESVRQLETGVINIGTRHALMGSDINFGLVKDVLQGIAENSKEITVENIKKLVVEKFGIDEEGIVSKSRKQKLAKPRQVAIFLCRKYTEHSLQQIAKCFKRQHATAIHAIKTVEKELKSKTILGKQVELLSEHIENGKL